MLKKNVIGAERNVHKTIDRKIDSQCTYVLKKSKVLNVSSANNAKKSGIIKKSLNLCAKNKRGITDAGLVGLLLECLSY